MGALLFQELLAHISIGLQVVFMSKKVTTQLPRKKYVKIIAVTPSPPDLSSLSHEQKDELIVTLFAQQAVLLERIKALEARLALNSTNSSRPPSSDGLRKPAPKSLRVAGLRPTGGQKGHSGSTLSQSTHIDQIIEHRPGKLCPACQSTMADSQMLQVADKRQVIELPVLKARVIEHRQMRALCICGASHVGQFPEGVNAPVQYGGAVKALAVHLNQYHLLPLQRTCQVMQDAFGVSVSQASIQSFSQQAALALSPTVAAIGQAVQSSNIVHADESGIRIQGKLNWLHCAVTSTLSWLAWHSKRGMAAFEALGVLTGVRGTLVHDGLLGYKNLDCLHSLCNAHHLRELVFVHEYCDQKIWDGWAQEMMGLLIQAKGEVAQAAQVGSLLGSERQAWYEAQWESLLRRGEQINPEAEREGAPTGKRGKLAQSTAFNLLKRLRTYRSDVWRFMTDRDVPFTNNLAEQALRMSKVKQKISGGFRTEHGASTFFTIRSYLATMHKQKANILDCLVSTFNGQPTQPCLAG